MINETRTIKFAQINITKSSNVANNELWRDANLRKKKMTLRDMLIRCAEDGIFIEPFDGGIPNSYPAIDIDMLTI